MSAGARIELSGVGTAYDPERPVLKDISLAVDPGEVVGLVGPNGAGKSTLLRCLVGLVATGSGRVLVDGVDVARAGRRQLRAVRRHSGFAFQALGLAGSLTALANVLHGALGRSSARGWWAATATDAERQAALRCLARVGLADRAGERVERLSGGQRQRVAVARTLMQRPSLLLADEPLASLDPAAGAAVMDLLLEERRLHGTTVLVALHQLDAARCCDRLIGLRDGRLAFDRPCGGFAAKPLEDLYVAAPA